MKMNPIAADFLFADIVFFIFWGVPFAGFGTIVSLFLFIIGVLALMIGILSEYVGLIYEEVKARPNYIVSEHIHK